ncbi:MAG: protein TolR [Marinomonas sp.]|uniref:protein TolR n=1 Tax=unclassified Marinomonas TaxID=196814 RepID=UPI0007AEFF71|nr:MULTISPECIES: protein TolR [unclassified Marinomonas]KZM43605.1 biopolymer transporter TolR [Marinomonas sp. SBI22]KZM47167.1 biopolymer transporter TolR [Marinomonas sp. SBI8L]
MARPNRRTRRKPMAEINVVPYIDVMLVLLVIFMITAPMLTQGVDVELPSANAAPIEDPQSDVLVASINASGEYFIDFGGEQSSLPLIELQDKVKKVIAQNPSLPVLVRGDRSVAYGDVIGLMVALQAAGVPNVGLVTEPEAP